MPTPAVPPASRIAEVLAGAVAVVAAVPVVRGVTEAMLVRRTFNGDIEWMEGALLVSALRAKQGLPLYDLPADDYIPFIYPPLHAWLLGTLGQVFPLGYELGRTVSMVCTLVAVAALVFGARRAGASWLLALASGGLFVQTWAAGGTFYDLVRTDALSLARASWALVLGSLPSARATVASGLLLAVAFTAKQHVALLGIPMLLAIGHAHGRKRALQFAAASAGPALLFLLGMGIATRGSFLAWLVLVPGAHGQSLSRLFPLAQIEVWKALPITTTAVLLCVAVFRRRAYWAGVALTTLLIVSLMRGHTGGFVNVLIPAFWVSALLPAVVVGALAERPAFAPWARIGAPLLVALQLCAWQTSLPLLIASLRKGEPLEKAIEHARVDLKKYVPTDADAVKVASLVEQIASLDGRVLIPHAPWYAVMAGKEPSFALIALWDIDHKGGHYRPEVAHIDDRIATEFEWAILPDDKLGHGLKKHFVRAQEVKVQTVASRAGWTVKLRQAWKRTRQP